MPTYDYRCKACGAELEMFQSITESAKRKCPECGKLKLERLIGAGAAILFKGSGYYQTDYRSDSYKAAEKADKKAASEAAETKKSDTKKSGTKKADKSGGEGTSGKPKKKS